MENLIKRSDKLAFYSVNKDGKVTFKRMTGFTDMSISKNPKEYTRQYIDEEFEQSDVVGYSPAISFAFDSYLDNDVHTDIMAIADKELTGDEAVREIVIVDIKNGNENDGYYAIKRQFSVIPDGEGNGNDAYQYSGSFEVRGEKVFGKAKTNDDWSSCTFESTDA